MYVEKKKINGKIYNYLRVSVRSGKKVKTKTIAYLGKDPMTKKELNNKISKFSKKKIEYIKGSLKKELEDKTNLKFLSEKQLEKLSEIKKDFSMKLKLDSKLLNDMFKDFKTYYIYNTNAIEGNTMTLKETNMLLNENKTPEGRDLKEIHDHINEKETFDYILNSKPEITKELIIKIHSMLLKNIDKRIGSFRSHNVRVFGASFDTTDAKYVAVDMDILLKWYKENKRILHPLILAAIFHEKFERIHPFYDGNGRTGRMLINLILLKSGLPPLIIKNRTRKKYYNVLSIGHKADLTKTDVGCYKDIVKFSYKQIVDTYKKIFSKWG